MKVTNWKLHGEATTRDLIAGLLPSSGMHFIVCENDDERRAIVADMAVAIASGNVANIVQEAKKAEGWRVEGGFLGLQTGERKGVAIIGAAKQSDMAAAAAWRAIKSPLPIAVSTALKDDVVSARLHDLSDGIRPTPLGLVVVSANWSRGVEEVRRILNFGNGSWATIVVSAEAPPTTMIRDGSRVIRVADRSLSLAHPATVTPWSRSFGLEAISINGERAWGVRASAEAASVPEIVMAAPDAPQTQEIRTIVFGSDGVSTLDEVVAAVRDSDAPARIVAPASEQENIREALDEAKEVANRRLDLALGYRLRDARDRIVSAA